MNHCKPCQNFSVSCRRMTAVVIDGSRLRRAAPSVCLTMIAAGTMWMITGGTAAHGQLVVTYSPVVTAAPVVVPVTTFSVTPVTTVASPTVVYRPVVTGAWAPTTVAYRVPVTVLSPVTTVSTFEVASAVTTVSFSPVVTAVPVGPPVYVRTSYFVPGEPVRNFFRSFAP